MKEVVLSFFFFFFFFLKASVERQQKSFLLDLFSMKLILFLSHGN